MPHIKRLPSAARSWTCPAQSSLAVWDRTAISPVAECASSTSSAAPARIRTSSLIGDHADRSRFDVRLGTVGSPGALQEDAERMGFPTFALGADRRSGYPGAILRLARRLRSEQVDVIQTHLLDGCFVGLAAARLARTPVAIFTAHHSHEIPLQDRRWLTAVDRLCAGPLCDAIIAPSAQMRDTLVRVHRVLAGEGDRGAPRVRARPARPCEGARRCGSPGARARREDRAHRDRAYVLDREPRGPRQGVRAGGSGGAGGDARARRARATPGRSVHSAGAWESGDRLHCLGPRGDVVDLLAATDLFVHPARAESFAMVIVEAMAMACPVVATPVGIAPEVVVDGRTGILSESPEPEGLARALERALAVRDRWDTMGEEARRSAARFPAAGMVRSYEDLYERLLRRDRDQA